MLPIFDHADFTDPAAEAEIGWVIDLVTQVEPVRAEMNIPPATLTALVLAGASAETKERAPRWRDVIKRMARLSDSPSPTVRPTARSSSTQCARGGRAAAEGRD
uniref:hypothetical protein n=1 Tax=Rhizobium lupini TaxID=136996 RepID=UPI003F64C4F7